MRGPFRRDGPGWGRASQGPPWRARLLTWRVVSDGFLLAERRQARKAGRPGECDGVMPTLASVFLGG